MSWLSSFLVGAVCGGVGCAAAVYVAERYSLWFHWSQREGSAGYAVAFFGLLGIVAGFITGVAASRLASGPPRAFGVSLAIVVGVPALFWLAGRALGDVPPEIGGETLRVLVEVRMPRGWQPGNRVKADRENLLLLDRIHPGSAPIPMSSRSIAWRHARQENGHWIIPGSAGLRTDKGSRGMAIQLGGAEIARFLAPLPARPGAGSLQWSDWLPRVAADDPVASGVRYRFRLEKESEVRRLEDEAERRSDETRLAALSALPADAPVEQILPFLVEEREWGPQTVRHAAGTRLRERPEVLKDALASPDPLIARLALLGVGTLNEVPAALFAEPLRRNAVHMAEGLRAFRERYDPKDPDVAAAADWQQRYQSWSTAWTRVRDSANPPPPPPLSEIEAIRREALLVPDVDEMRTLALLAASDLENWR